MTEADRKQTVPVTVAGRKQTGSDKIARNPVTFDADAPKLRKPEWIRVRIPSGNAVGRLSGAASGQSRVELEGTRFRARLERNRDDTRQVVISVTPVAVNPEGAQEAGRLEATKYCLKTFGSSDTAWEIGPDLPVEELEIVDDRIVLVGRCTQR